MHNLDDNPVTRLYSARSGFWQWLPATLKGASVVGLVWVGGVLGLSVSPSTQTIRLSLLGDCAIAQISTPVDPGEATPAPEASPTPGTSPQPGISPSPLPTDNPTPQPPAPNNSSPQPTTPNPTQPPTQPQTIPSPTPTTTPTNSAQPTPPASPTQGSPTPNPSPSVEVSPSISPTVSPSVEAAPTPVPEPNPTTQTRTGFPWWIVVGIGGVAIAAGAVWAFTRKTSPSEPLVDRVAPEPTLPDEPLPPSPAALPAPSISLSEVKLIPKMDRVGSSTVTTPGALGMNFNVAVKLRPDPNSRVTIATKTSPATSLTSDRGEPTNSST